MPYLLVPPHIRFGRLSRLEGMFNSVHTVRVMGLIETYHTVQNTEKTFSRLGIQPVFRIAKSKSTSIGIRLQHNWSVPSISQNVFYDKSDFNVILHLEPHNITSQSKCLDRATAMSMIDEITKLFCGEVFDTTSTGR